MRTLGLAAAVFGVFVGVACGSDVTNFPEGEGGGGATGGSGQGGDTGGSSATMGSAGSGGGTGGAGGTGGGMQGSCDIADGDYGDCDLPLGWAFDGADCAPFSGCDCAPDCALFSGDLETCVAACSGYCDNTAFLGDGIAADGWGEGAFCDEIFLCLKNDTAAALSAIVPGLLCNSGSGCSNGETHCIYSSTVTVSAAQMTELCSATLVPDVDEIYCMVLGP